MIFKQIAYKSISFFNCILFRRTLSLNRLNQKSLYSNFSNKNYYEVLGINRNASSAEIKAAYIKLSKLYHPDTTNYDIEKSYDQYIMVREAFDVLSDKEAKLSYDQEICYDSPTKIYKRRKSNINNEETESAEEKQMKEDEKNAMKLMKESPVYKLLGYLYACIAITVLLMLALRKSKDKK